MHFLTNENSPAQSVRRLREDGYTVVSVQEEMPGSHDIAILERACRENLIILTFDKDYGELIYRYNSFIPPDFQSYSTDEGHPACPSHGPFSACF